MRDTRAKEIESEGTTTKTKPRTGLSTFGSLAYRDYRFLWLGMLFSGSGQWIQQVTLSWLVYDMTNSAVMLGLINGLRAIPFLFSGPLAGVAADRMDRKKLMLWTQVILMTTAILMGLLVQTGTVQVWHLFVFTLVSGVAWSFNQPVRQALVPSLVPPEVLMNAIALSAAAMQLTRIAGPAVGGLLIGLMGVSGNFFLQGFAYLGVAVMIYQMRIPPNAGRFRNASVLSDLADGLRYVRHNVVVLSLIIMALVPMIFYMPYQTLMPIFARDVFKIGPEGLGLLMAAPGIGAVASTLTIASLGNFQRKGALLFGAGIVMGGALLIFGTSGWLPGSLLMLVVIGGAAMAYFATNNTILQQIIPDELRGRVMAIYMLDMGLQPLGSLLAGGMASFLGAPQTLQILGATVFIFITAALLKVPHLRRLA